MRQAKVTVEVGQRSEVVQATGDETPLSFLGRVGVVLSYGLNLVGEVGESRELLDARVSRVEARDRRRARLRRRSVYVDAVQGARERARSLVEVYQCQAGWVARLDHPDFDGVPPVALCPQSKEAAEEDAAKMAHHVERAIAEAVLLERARCARVARAHAVDEESARAIAEAIEAGP